MKTSTNNKNSRNISIAEQYYSAIAHKDLATASQFLDPNVLLLSPLAEVVTKEEVLKALEGFLLAIESLEIRAVFEKNDQVMLALDPCFYEQSIGRLRTAALVTIKNNLITNIELFYDSSPLINKKEKIFTQQN